MRKRTRSNEPPRPWWHRRRVAVLGGTGFIGSHLVERLVEEGALVRVVGRSAANASRFLSPVLEQIDLVEADCADHESARRAVAGCDVVMHLAGVVAGIALNRARPAWMFASNARLLMPVFDACVSEAVPRVLYMSSACVYSDHVSIPTPEEEGFLDDPEPTNRGYGWSKRVGEVMARLYAEEYGLNVVVVRPYNAYGSRDNFEPGVSHVIPSLIRRVESEPGDLVVWGTGRQTRSFIYVEDLARGLIAAVERAPGPEPINLGSAEEITIGELARLVVEASGRTKRVVFDTSKPDGQRRRQPRLTRARELLGFEATTPLREGLARAIEHYRSSVGAGVPTV